MSIELIELFDIFSGTFGKEKAQIAIKDIEALIADHKRELATKSNLQETECRLNKSIESVKEDVRKVDTRLSEVELRLIKEIELVRREINLVRKDVADSKSSTIKWMIGFIISQTVILLTVITLLKLT